MLASHGNKLRLMYDLLEKGDGTLKSIEKAKKLVDEIFTFAWTRNICRHIFRLHQLPNMQRRRLLQVGPHTVPYHPCP